MNKTAQLFYDIGEPFAAGFFELPEASAAKKFCRAYRRLYETCPLPPYTGTPLYPTELIGDPSLVIYPQYCRQYRFNMDKLKAKSPEAAAIFDEFDQKHGRFQFVDGMEEVSRYTTYIDAWNHGALNLERIIAEGVDRYEQRVREMNTEDLREALLDVLAGIRCYHGRVLAHLEAAGAQKRLLDALKKVPFSPAQTAYEALVCANFMFCFDGCDDIGYVDSWLPALWNGEDLTDVMHCMMESLQRSSGWSMTLGPEYSELTKQWLRASQGLARPMVELRTAPHMPDDLWELALERVLSGGGQPSFYNETAIQRRLAERMPDAPKEDLLRFAGMGCTETSLSGMTYCGGIDVNLNVLKILRECMDEELAACQNFETFYEAFFRRLHAAQDHLMAYVNAYYLKRAEVSFAPIRTLFVDDCIEKEQGYFQGGARYAWAIPSDSGIPNAVDSLLAVKELVFERKLYDAKSFISALDGQDPLFLSLLANCPAYGAGNAKADALMHELTSRFYAYYRRGEFVMGRGFFPTSHQFLRHVPEGGVVGATPDGRKPGQSVSDSIAAVSGKALKGPTQMLLSAAAYAQEEIYGIPVLNLSITKKYDPRVLRALIEGYFELGGTQIQITSADRETLLAAKADPKSHRDLIVRVGGYSAFFCDLSSELQNAVIERTVFS